MDTAHAQLTDVNGAMSVWLRNLQSRIQFNSDLLKLHSTLLLHLLCSGSSRFKVNIVCVEEDEIRHLNKVYRKKDTPTDVLSFPYHEVMLSCMISTIYML